MELARYRPNVGIVLVNASGKVWLGRRANTPGPTNWQFPQGGLEAGEAPRDGALRELREETGATSVTPIGNIGDWIAYDFPPEHPLKGGKAWLGQKQLWFVFRFTGADEEFDLSTHDEVEFDAWRWAELDEALDTVVDFKRDAYRRVMAAVRPLIQARPRTSAQGGQEGRATA